jgi:uncharacterized delta-60 repeat protein
MSVSIIGSGDLKYFKNNQWVSLGQSSDDVDVQIFTESGSWVKPEGYQMVKVYCVGAGQGGGSGRKGAENTSTYGGMGGFSGTISYSEFEINALLSTETVTIGAGGLGGQSRTTNSTSGENGLEGGSTQFGDLLRARGGFGFNSGSTGVRRNSKADDGTESGNVSFGNETTSHKNLSSSSFNFSGTFSTLYDLYPNIVVSAPSFAGGYINLSNEVFNFENAKYIPSTNSLNNLDFINFNFNYAVPGESSITQNATSGENGEPTCGGGGGGASRDNIGDSGAGGNGGDGICVVISYKANVQGFDASGTWTKPSGNFKKAKVWMVGAGGGAGSGAVAESGVISRGGQPGVSGAIHLANYNLEDLPESVLVTIGEGGLGGSAQYINDSFGNPGLSGGSTSFGDILDIEGSLGGQGGTTGSNAMLSLNETLGLFKPSSVVSGITSFNNFNNFLFNEAYTCSGKYGQGISSTNSVVGINNNNTPRGFSNSEQFDVFNGNKIFPFFGSTVYSIKIGNDLKIVTVGAFTSPTSRIARLKKDYSLDSSFTVGTSFNSTSTTRIAIQTDGKILVGGAFTTYNETSSPRIARLNADGTLDSGFSIGTGFSSTVNTIAIQTDGKILVGGSFSTYNGTSSPRIARLNADGTLDSGFSIGTSFNSSVNTIEIQSDGKILVGGAFSAYNGTSSPRIARLNADGTLDSSFTVGTGFNSNVNTIAIQTDGKILVGGAFTTYNGTSSVRIARLNADGTLDSGFSVGTGFDGTVTTIAIQTDGKILVGGAFSTYNGTSSPRIARLNADGTLDSGFSIGTSFNSTVYTIAIQADEKILVGGAFTTYNEIESRRIARLKNDGSISVTDGDDAPDFIYPNHGFVGGFGGGSGGSLASTNASSGGNGGKRGGSGGGGGAARNGFISGAGGNGGNGYVLVVCY